MMAQGTGAHDHEVSAVASTQRLWQRIGTLALWRVAALVAASPWMAPIGPLNLLLAPRCVSCRTSCAPQQLLCAACWRAMPWLPDPLCERCGLPQPCGTPCPAAEWAFSRSWAPLDYAGPVIALIRALKERGAIQAADLMAATIVARAPARVLLDGAVLVPVPADPWRRRRRGIDHAAVLADAIARRSGNDIVAALQRRPGGRQAGRSRAQRVAAGPTVQANGALVGRDAVLVDDVHTTGATLHAAALALNKAGAGRIACVTFGRSI